eukprot:1267532-Pleurochrysis_carterae.AAC.2
MPRAALLRLRGRRRLAAQAARLPRSRQVHRPLARKRPRRRHAFVGAWPSSNAHASASMALASRC